MTIRTHADDPSGVRLAEVLQVLRPHVPSVLVTSAAFRQVQAMAAGFPALLGQCVHLEVRLGPHTPRTDLIFALIPGPVWRVAVPTAGETHPVWRGVKMLGEAVTDSASRLYGAIKIGWLEFDAATEPGAPVVPVPGVFAGLQTPPGALEDRRAWEALIAAEVVWRLRDARLPPMVRSRLGAVLTALPASAHLHYVGWMPQRSDVAVRLCIAGLSPSELMAYVQQIGWPGVGQTVATILRNLGGAEGMGLHGCMEANLLHLDVWEMVQPRIGLEFIFARKPQVRGRLAESDWLGHLVSMKLCTPEKRIALAQWPGYAFEAYPHLGTAHPTFRYVNHVKVVAEGGRLEAKAYLTFELNAWPRRRRASGARMTSAR